MALPSEPLRGGHTGCDHDDGAPDGTPPLRIAPRYGFLEGSPPLADSRSGREAKDGFYSIFFFESKSASLLAALWNRNHSGFLSHILPTEGQGARNSRRRARGLTIHCPKWVCTCAAKAFNSASSRLLLLTRWPPGLIGRRSNGRWRSGTACDQILFFTDH